MKTILSLGLLLALTGCATSPQGPTALDALAIDAEVQRLMRREDVQGVRAERIYPEISRLLLGETKMPWRWEYDWLEGLAHTH